MLTRTTRLLLLVPLSIALVRAPAVAQRDDRPDLDSGSASELSTIAGTLHLYGCPVAADAIELRAIPLTLVGPDGRRPGGDPRAPDLQTRLQPGRTPHVHSFSIRGVRPGAPYLLQVRLHPLDACGTVLWRAPMDGIVFGGSARVALEGFAVRTMLEVQDADGDWVGADELQLHKPGGAVRTFRWRTTLSGTLGGQLMVSLKPFPMEPLPLPCAEPDEGVVHREMLTLRPGEREQVFSLDLGAVLRDVQADRRNAAALRPFLAGAPVYVRVVPELAEGLACDPEQHGNPQTNALGIIPPGLEGPPAVLPPVLPLGDHSYTPPYLGGPAEGRPTYWEKAYKIIRPHTLPPVKCGSTPAASKWWGIDPLGCLLIDFGEPPGSTVQPGGWFNVTVAGKSSGGLWSSFVSSLSNLGKAVVAGAGLAVNWASTAWEDIQDAVAKVVVDVITWVPGIGDACDALAKTGAATCESVVKTGIQAGLMAMGVPPSIPNWEALQEEGIDYLAAEMATQIETSTGVPSQLSQAALKELAKTAMEKIQATRGAGPGPAYDWVIPYFGFEPAVLRVSLFKVTSTPIPSGLTLTKQPDLIYRGAQVPVPAVFPGSGILRFPIVLQPRLDGLPAPYCQKFGGFATCKPLEFITKWPLCQYAEITKGALNGVTWVNYDCATETATTLYYRDLWREERFKKWACIQLKAASFLTGFLGLPIWSPEHTFVMTAWVKPPVYASWDGDDFSACAM